MDTLRCGTLLLLLVVVSRAFTSAGSTEVCSNAMLLGLKGDPGDKGDEGDQGRLGKTGQPGQQGLRGEMGCKGEQGPPGKTGPAGQRGGKGECGIDGSPGLKGNPGSTCDCGKYRKVVGQMDINIGKLKNSINFVKNGIKETEDKYYLVVKEARNYKEALLNCRLRGGTLAVPKTEDALIATYISQAGLTRVFVGTHSNVQVGKHALAHNFTAGTTVGTSRPLDNNTCVELTSTGDWAPTDCDVTMYYVCEFNKRRKVPTTAL